MSGDLGASVKRAVIWRSGSQIFAQAVAWASTLMVIRILDPSDYGLFAMTQVVIVFLNFLNGYGFAGSLIREAELSEQRIRQAFGVLLLVNAALALLQVGLAPLAADYYEQPRVGALLQVQALIFLSTPFAAIPQVLLTRAMDFRKQGLVNIAATLVSATVALACALAGFGVWTLVFAPLALFWARAIGLQVAVRTFYRPSFRFAGTGPMFRFGLALLASSFGWTVMTQADTAIAARWLSPGQLGLYAEAFFLTSLIASKFVPPLNEVAYPAYARMQDDPRQLAVAFLKAVRLIMLVTCPLYLGLSVVAPDAITLVLGEKWRAMAPLVTVLALAMPVQTLHILFAPAVNALGHTRITMRSSLFGALLMPLAFFAGVHWGAMGLAYAWLLAFPLVPLFTFVQARATLGIDARRLAAAVAPGLLASSAMALVVWLVGRQLGAVADWQRLSFEVACGAGAYVGALVLFSRDTVAEAARLIVRRRARPAAGAAA
jgi:O-antigen/teichoic acid export membrane protein